MHQEYSKLSRKALHLSVHISDGRHLKARSLVDAVYSCSQGDRRSSGGDQLRKRQSCALTLSVNSVVSSSSHI